MDVGDGRILIVDDDAGLLRLMDAYLSRLGYRVECCLNASQAWVLMKADPAAYSGALVDLNMPGMRGEELVRRILESNAAIRLVVVSGHPGGQSAVEKLDGNRVRFLLKPFAPNELADAFKFR
jgi:DNA-binding NtrC family response regulator